MQGNGAQVHPTCADPQQVAARVCVGVPGMNRITLVRNASCPVLLRMFRTGVSVCRNDDKGKRVFFQSFPKEPLIKSVIVMPAKAGIQERSLKPLDSGFRRNDDKGESGLV